MNVTTACPDLAGLREYLLGRMSEPSAAAVEAHLAACAECRKLLPTVQAEDDLVADFRTQAGRAEPAGALLDRLAVDLRGRLLPPDATKAQPAPARREPPPVVEAMRAQESWLPGLEEITEIKQVGSYRILRTLGAGGMGMVFQAEDVQLKRLVALKVMKPALAANELALRRFLREARAAAAVKHDHIVTIYQVGEDQDMPFLAMEFLEGESLDDRLKREEAALRACKGADGGLARSPLPLAEVLRIAREIAEGLAAAHQHGLIHRDIKPGNVWLETMESIHAPAPRPPEDAFLLGQAPGGGDADTVEMPKNSFTIPVARGRVKILDFGLARATDDAPLTRTGAILGTPAYMSPEQANGDKIDHRCDLFSLGCVLYRMCTGRMAFKGSTSTGILLAIIRQQPKPPRELNPELPPAVNDLVMRLLAKDADDRPASAHAVAKAIKAIEWELARVQGAQATAAASPTPQTVTESRRSEQAAPAGPSVPLPPVPTRGLSSRWLLTAAAAFLFAAVCLAAVITLRTKNGTLVVSVTEPDVQVLVDGEEKLVIDSKKVGRVELIPGEHKLTVKRGQEELFTDSFSLKSGGEVVIDAKWTPKPQQVANGVDEAPLKPVAAFDAWCKQVAAMTPDEQVKAVSDDLKKRNPGFDGKVTPTVENGVVVGLEFVTNDVTDIAPVRALPALRSLKCAGSGPGKGRLADLSPLKDMKLTFLDCGWTKVSDLSPLKDMKLTTLYCGDTKVSDLSPLKGMPLTTLWCNNMSVSDLSPLKDMKLTTLYCYGTKVSDLSPLKGMKLTYLNCGYTPVSDLSPLKEMPLKELWCGNTRVSDLSPIKDISLTVVECWGAKVSDLSPLKETPLKYLRCDFKSERDADILRSISTLETINDRSAADFWKDVEDKKPVPKP